MAYDINLAPQTVEEWEILITTKTAEAKAAYDQQVVQAETAYASLPDTTDKPPLRQYLALAVEPLKDRAYWEKYYRAFYPQAAVSQAAPTLAELKAEKLAELAADFEAACQKAKVTTPDGWEADANAAANTNVEGLIKLLEATDPEATVQFCGADNAVHEIDLAGLRALQLQIIQNGQRLYQAKWLLRDAIELANSREELDALGRLSHPAGHSA